MTKSLLIKIGIFLAVTAAVFAIAIPLVMSNTDYKGDSKQVLDNLNIQATVTDNGDMTVKETWQITLENRDQAYRNIYKRYLTLKMHLPIFKTYVIIRKKAIR